MDKTFVPTADLKRALLLMTPYADPADDPDRVRGEAAETLMKALGLKTLAADPFDGMLDEQRRVEEIEGPLIARQAAGDRARAAITHIEAPLGDAPQNWPETWEGKAFAKVEWDGEDEHAFLCISADQSGTILGDYLSGLSIEVARARLLQAMFLGGLTAQQLVLHERQNTPLYQQADAQARLALAADLPQSKFAGRIPLQDYARACRVAGVELSSEHEGATGELLSEPWFDRADEAERRMSAGELYL